MSVKLRSIGPRARPLSVRSGERRGNEICQEGRSWTSVGAPAPALLRQSGRPFSLLPSQISRKNGGGGIRTLVRGKPPETVFETAAFNRSATPPGGTRLRLVDLSCSPPSFCSPRRAASASRASGARRSAQSGASGSAGTAGLRGRSLPTRGEEGAEEPGGLLGHQAGRQLGTMVQARLREHV